MAKSNKQTLLDELSPAEDAGQTLVDIAQMIEQIGNGLKSGFFEFQGSVTAPLQGDNPAALQAWAIKQLEEAIEKIESAKVILVGLPLEYLPELFKEDWF